MNIRKRRATSDVALIVLVSLMVSIAAPTADAQAKEKPAGERTAFFRASGAGAVPSVALSAAHKELCKVKVGDTLPAIKLPALDGGDERELGKMLGEKATVVVFWKSDRRMAHQELADLGPDVVEPFGKSGVAVVGIVVGETAERAKPVVEELGAKLPNLVDADGAAFAQVGSGPLPRTFLVDASGKILWFDLEYSNATRRELQQALRALTGAKGNPAIRPPVVESHPQ